MGRLMLNEGVFDDWHFLDDDDDDNDDKESRLVPLISMNHSHVHATIDGWGHSDFLQRFRLTKSTFFCRYYDWLRQHQISEPRREATRLTSGKCVKCVRMSVSKRFVQRIPESKTFGMTAYAVT